MDPSDKVVNSRNSSTKYQYLAAGIGMGSSFFHLFPDIRGEFLKKSFSIDFSEFTHIYVWIINWLAYTGDGCTANGRFSNTK